MIAYLEQPGSLQYHTQRREGGKVEFSADVVKVITEI